ncbi:antifreeze protein [Rhodobacteraceae bacterium SC52]|uniref:Antifreeze protein n=2 Tax=Meridianimarinicoccus aquatilis TaxID=2552766 RepID=A0A4R6B4D5_9RHOB|nr:antifreeze protein [Rhodobacteraceae bacterium SC52]TDL91332.1 antifreeze protein [Fluviibacterium aquatile]
MNMATPIQTWQAGVQLATMLAEAQMVVTLRVLGQLGLWSVTAGENERMVSEKPEAFLKSANAVISAVHAGKRPDQVLSAAVTPLGRKTRSNMHRLAKRGPGLPK